MSLTRHGTIDGSNGVFYDFDQTKQFDTATTRYTRQRGNFHHVAASIGDEPVVPKDRHRQMVIFSQCMNVRVTDVVLPNSPFWTLHFVNYDAVIGIRLWTSLLVINADSTDVDGSRNMTVGNCHTRAGDDALVITGYSYHFEVLGFTSVWHAYENIDVNNYNIQSSSSGIRLGFLDQNPMRNVSNCDITNSMRGIGIFLRDKCSLKDLTLTNVRVETKLRTGD